MLTGCKSRPTQAAGPAAMVVPVTTAQVTVQAVPLELRIVGTVEPSSKVEVKSQIAGQLMSVHFTEGQDVQQGALLFEIDPRPYREALRQAEAAVQKDEAQLMQARATVQKDEAQAKFAEADAARYDDLAKEGIVSKQQHDQYRTTAQTSQETVRADRAAIDSAQAALNSDKAAVDTAKLNLSYCEIRAPIAGRTGTLMVHAGNLVKVNDVTLVTINKLSPVFVSFNAPEENLEAVRRFSSGGRRLAVQVTSRDDPNTKAIGYLSLLDNIVDSQTGTIHLKATFENQNRVLWPGQYVNVVLTLETAQSATVVPSEAVQAGQQGQYVYVVKADKTVEPRIVSVGRTVEHKVVIDKGVNPGETVVTDGQMMLFPGAHIFPVPAPPKLETGA
jgi:multidrug efflux system membrane fusion protein